MDAFYLMKLIKDTEVDITKTINEASLSTYGKWEKQDKMRGKYEEKHLIK